MTLTETNVNTLSLLIHADSKAGKTTLSTTAPPPICVLDAEGGYKFVREAGYKTGVPLRRCEWDPMTGPPPRYDGTWDFCHVMIRQWATLTQAYGYLARTGEHDFKSLVLDSVTEAQRKLKAKIAPSGDMKDYRDWGALLTGLDKLIRDMRDLVLLPQPNPLQVVVFIAETEMKDGSWRPAMQGQIGRSMPYWVDCCAYLYTRVTANDDGQPAKKTKELLIAQGLIPNIIAGERFQGALPDVITDPHITRMMEQLFGADYGHPRSNDEQEVPAQ